MAGFSRGQGVPLHSGLRISSKDQRWNNANGGRTIKSANRK